MTKTPLGNKLWRYRTTRMQILHDLWAGAVEFAENFRETTWSRGMAVVAIATGGRVAKARKVAVEEQVIITKTRKDEVGKRRAIVCDFVCSSFVS